MCDGEGGRMDCFILHFMDTNQIPVIVSIHTKYVY